MIDTLIIAIVMVTDTISIESRVKSVSRDIDIEAKVEQIVYEKCKCQNKVFWFPLNIFIKREEL